MKRISLYRALDIVPLAAAFLIFCSIIALSIPTDIQIHSSILSSFVANHRFPIPPLYYALIFIGSGLQSNVSILNMSAVLVLTTAVWLKYLITLKMASIDNNKKRNGLHLKICVISVLFLAPVFYNLSAKSMYLGRISPNVWHNSTTIFAMPIVLLTFLKAFDFLKNKNPGKDTTISLLLLGLINVLIKPSFLFCLIPSLSMMSLMRYGVWSRSFIMSGLIGTIFLSCIALEYYIIYQLSIYNIIYRNDSSSVIIAPFRFWSIYSNNILLDSVFSLVFPIVCLVLISNNMRKRMSIHFSLCLFIFSIIIGILFAESGERLSHGNFFWQVIMCSYILFALLSVYSLDEISRMGWTHPKSIVLAGAFCLHLASGALYIFKIFYTSSYW